MSSRDRVHSCQPETTRTLLGFPLKGISPHRVPAHGKRVACYGTQLAWCLLKRLPMSELQKASWGWLGEHVHASAPQCPRLQQPRSKTSPSQGVIIVAAAVRCGDGWSSLQSCRVLARILQSELTRQV